jgi:Cd2+/Zn2+-exporting ATPase
MTEAHEKLRLEIPILLPEVSEAKDRCVAALTATLSARDGTGEVHVLDKTGGAPQLCIHYQPDVISLTRVRELALSVGAQLTKQTGHLLLQAVDTLHARAARSMATQIRAWDGVLEADVAASGLIRSNVLDLPRRHQNLLVRDQRNRVDRPLGVRIE